jgi:phosphate transport system substrate-binding protein
VSPLSTAPRTKRSAVTALALALALVIVVAGCSGPTRTGSVVVSGSSTVEPITIRVAELFNDSDPTVDLLVDGPGTGDGFELFCDGETDINDASSKIAQEQIDACIENDIDFIELQIANDGIAIMTNDSNDAIDCVSTADLYALVGPESQGVTTWDQANDLSRELGGDGDLPDLSLDVIGPGEESGTFTSFIELVIEQFSEDRGQHATTRPDYQASSDDNVIIQGVSGSPSSLAWAGYAFAREAEGVKLLEVDGGDGCVAPTEATIADGSYPISRPLFIYVSADKVRSNPALAAFVDFYLSDEGLGAVTEVGYVGLDEQTLERTRALWRTRTIGAA